MRNPTFFEGVVTQATTYDGNISSGFAPRRIGVLLYGPGAMRGRFLSNGKT